MFLRFFYLRALQLTVVRLWQILVKIMFQSLFGSLLNYRYGNENVSLGHLSWIFITSILTTIYSLKSCSVYGRSCRIYSPKSLGFFRKEFRQVSKKWICYLPAKGRSVWWKTATSFLKILPEPCRGQHFQDRGRSFSAYGPTLSRQIKYIYIYIYIVALTSWYSCNVTVLRNKKFYTDACAM